MSLSSGNEVKTAAYHLNVVGGTETATIDATEDREIVGFTVSVSGAGNLGEYMLRIGSDRTPSAGQAQDNLHFLVNSNEALDQNGAFYGSGEGFQWNEDASLTAEVSETGGADDISLVAQVYYREV